MPSDRFLDLIAGRSETLELDQAALEIAALHDPASAARPALETLDAWAAAIEARLSRGAGGAEFLTTTNRFLFEEVGLAGDQEDYFHPANSCLDSVLIRRRGLPITLSLIYLEIARRLLRPVYGIGLPSHFVVQYNDGLINLYVDPFHGGRLLTPKQCLELVGQATGGPIENAPLLFAAQTKRQILLRMLNNLRGAYTRRGDQARAIHIGALLAQATASNPL